MGHLEKCFNPEATSAMGAAFDSAWHELEASGSNFSSQFPPDRARETIAKRIIDMAQRGERDTERLSKDAFAYLARHAAPGTILHPQHRCIEDARKVGIAQAEIEEELYQNIYDELRDRMDARTTEEMASRMKGLEERVAPRPQSGVAGSRGHVPQD